jgi:uncharacterized protein with von Willebrand factor type A (vWA) domain
MPGEPARDVLDIMVGFARTLRHSGVDADGVRVHSMVEALGVLDVLAVDDVYWAGRLTLCSDRDDIDRFDAAFALYFGGGEAPRSPAAVTAPTTPTPEWRASLNPAAGEADGDDEPDEPIAVSASRLEVLAARDIASLTAAERAELNRLFVLLAPRTAGRRSFRYRTATRGSIDLSASVRRMLRNGGEPGAMLRRRRRTKPRRLVLLLDVSGSMAPYADAMLRFGHAAVRAAPTGTEVFTVGTRLTRVTRPLRLRDPDIALAQASRAIADWSGGTRLGETLQAFTDRWGQRGMARGAVVVVNSDGWERGDARLLGDQLARLRRLAHAVIWVNPHKAKDGFAPITAGMVAALPSVDRFVAGHSFDSLEELVRVIADA